MTIAPGRLRQLRELALAAGDGSVTIAGAELLELVKVAQRRAFRARVAAESRQVAAARDAMIEALARMQPSAARHMADSIRAELWRRFPRLTPRVAPSSSPASEAPR